MGKDNVVALDPDWHRKLATKSSVPEAKARKALDAVEVREARKLAMRKPTRRIPATGWSDPTEKLFSVEDLARHFGVSEATIRRAEKRGDIISEPCGKSGKILRFSRASVDAYKSLLATRKYG